MKHLVWTMPFLIFGFGLGVGVTAIILLLTAEQALATQLGVGEEVVPIAVAAVFGGTALAAGLAFGLGGKERARKLIDPVES